MYRERDSHAVYLLNNVGALLRRCQLYLKNREDAEDAAQETVLRAYRALHAFKGDASFRT